MSLLLGFRDHASLFIERAYIDNGQYEPVIYEPSGSYARSIDTGYGEQLFHDNASFEIYKDSIENMIILLSILPATMKLLLRQK